MNLYLLFVFRYYEVINTIRTTKSLKDSTQGSKLETNCRLNLALCKIKQEDYDVAIDQWERVLLQETGNIKALYRISVALNSQGNQLEAWSYIKRAYNSCPNDKAILELYNKLKEVKEAHQKKTKEEKMKKEQDSKVEEIDEQNTTNKNSESKQEDPNDSSDEDERAKSLKSGFKFSSEPKESKPNKTEENDVKIEEEKTVPT